ncbi:MAG: Chain length determinant protein [Actinomycetia bacterium]|nr:Chain length determinant protein [Actinomycetes bacterium]
MTEPGQPTGLSTQLGDSLPDKLWGYDDFPLADQRSADELSASLVDLSFITAALRRSRKVWLTFTAVGILAGIALLMTFKPAYQANAAVLLRNDPTIDAFTAMQTDAVEAQEPAVVQLADKTLGTPGAKLSYSVVISDNQVLTISVSARTPDAATNEVTAIASAFLAVHDQVERSQGVEQAQAEALQLTQDEQGVSSLQQQITQVSAEPNSSTQQQKLSSLHTQLTSAQNVLTSLKQTLSYNDASSQASVADMAADSKVLAISVPTLLHSEKKYAIEYVGGAFFAGLVIGIAVVAVRALMSDKLYRRDDVAVALAAPVRLSVLSAAKRKRSLSIRDKAEQRTADVARVVNYLRGSVPVSSRGPSTLAVVAVDDPALVVSAVTRLAASYAREGKRMCVADLAGGLFARSVGISDHGVHPVDMEGSRVRVVLPDPGDLAPIGPEGRASRSTTVSADVAAVYAASDVFVTIVVLDPAIGADHLPTWSRDVVAVVTAGKSSVARVQAVGEMVGDAGAHLASGVLLGADKGDDSFGLVRA